MNHGMWIWTELLAFDNTSPDGGAEAYLNHVGRVPEGISLLISGVDFILKNRCWKGDDVLPRDFCSRSGHYSNGFREVQPWTVNQLKNLIRELKKHGIKVIVSVFAYNLGDAFHEEFVNHEAQDTELALISVLKNGRRMDDYFTEKLAETLQDYGLDGWHACDGMAAPWYNLRDLPDFCVQEFIRQEKETEFPAFLREPVQFEEIEKRRAKLLWLHKNCWKKWQTFIVECWNTFWKKAIAAVHRVGGIVIANSPNSKSTLEALCYMGVDYRKLAEYGLDMMLMETTITAAKIIWKNRDFHHEFPAILAEMTALMPNVRMLMMPSIKDIVESYDVFEHAPAMFERDLYLLAAQHVVKNGKLERCSQGFFQCLGDCMERDEWKLLWRHLDHALSFKAADAGETVWITDPECFDPLMTEHHRYGAWSPYFWITALKNRENLDLTTVADVKEVSSVRKPLIVPCFNLFSREKQQKILNTGLPMLLLGAFRKEEIPANSFSIAWTPYRDYTVRAIFLNWKDLSSGETVIPQAEELPPFDDADPKVNRYRDVYPRLPIPEEFLEKTGSILRKALGEPRLKNGGRDLFETVQTAEDGSRRICVSSSNWFYREPELKTEDGAEPEIVTLYPKTAVEVRNGIVVSRDRRPKPLHIPPQGVIGFDVRKA